MKSKNHLLKAFTLVEMLMVIILISILGGTSLSMFSSTLNEAKFDATYKEMLELRRALIGDLENTSVEGERIRFGYIGDMGAVPTDSQGLMALYSLPSAAATWSVDATGNIGSGWNGPYIISSTDSDFSKDAWGNDYVYNTSGTTPYIMSYGSDGVLNGTETAADIIIEIPRNIRSATLTGQITSSGSAYAGPAYVQVFYPASDGVVTSQAATLSSGNMGQFTFSSIPFGVRSVKVQVPDSASPAVTVGPVAFAVDNENFFVQSNFLDVNPAYHASNCNSIQNVTYDEGTFNVENTTDIKRVHFKLNIERSFSINSIWIWNNGSHNNSKKIEKIGIGGVVYGCVGSVSWVVNKGNLNRSLLNVVLLVVKRPWMKIAI